MILQCTLMATQSLVSWCHKNNPISFYHKLYFNGTNKIEEWFNLNLHISMSQHLLPNPQNNTRSVQGSISYKLNLIIMEARAVITIHIPQIRVVFKWLSNVIIWLLWWVITLFIMHARLENSGVKFYLFPERAFS